MSTWMATPSHLMRQVAVASRFHLPQPTGDLTRFPLILDNLKDKREAVDLKVRNLVEVANALAQMRRSGLVWPWPRKRKGQ